MKLTTTTIEPGRTLTRGTARSMGEALAAIHDAHREHEPGWSMNEVLADMTGCGLEVVFSFEWLSAGWLAAEKERNRSS